MRFEPTLRSTSLKCTVATMGSMAFAWAGASSALAQSAPPAPGGAVANPFEGWSFGVGGGYNVFHANPEATSSFGKGTDFISPPGLKGDQWLGVFEGGYEFRHDNSVLGLFGDVQVGSASSSFASSASKGGVTGNLKLGAGGSMTAHLGLVVNESYQLYSLVGWSFRHYDASVVSTNGPTSSNEESGWVNGPTIGLGAAMAFPNYPNLSLKGEYRVTFFNGPTVTAGSGPFLTTVDYGMIPDQSFRVILSIMLPAS